MKVLFLSGPTTKALKMRKRILTKKISKLFWAVPLPLLVEGPLKKLLFCGSPYTVPNVHKNLYYYIITSWTNSIIPNVIFQAFLVVLRNLERRHTCIYWIVNKSFLVHNKNVWSSLKVFAFLV